MHTIDQAFADRIFHTAIEQMQSDTRGPALTNIRSIRARNRGERERRLRLVELRPEDRQEIVRNLHDRMVLFAALTHERSGPMPEGWAEEFAARAADMVLALARGSR